MTPDQGRFLGTAGVSQLEGTAGGGLTPWAVITGYGTEDSYGGSAYYARAKLSDFEMQSTGASFGIKDRLEVSFAEQTFLTGSTGPALGVPEGYKLKQTITGAKLRLSGNLAYDQNTWKPQISVGVQHKKINANNRPFVQNAGARDDEGIDYYISATKLWMDKNLIMSATLRGTKANQMGLMGFGGDLNNSHQLQAEGSLAYMINHRLVVGADYRMKPDNLSSATEGDAAAAYVAFFPNKNLSFALAAVDMGETAGQGRQRGVYVSTQLGF